eukprot:362153_1
MSTVQQATKWKSLTFPEIEFNTIIPSGTDANNYIIIDRACFFAAIIAIHKYNIDTDKWNKIDGIQNMSHFSAALDVKNQILFLFRRNLLTEIQLNSGNIVNHTHNTTLSPLRKKCIILNDSLFIIGGSDNKSILKWDLENKTFTKFSDMYNNARLGSFGMI